MGFAVAVPRIGLDAEKVIAAQFRFDALEQRRARADDPEQGAASGARERLEALGALQAISHRRDRDSRFGRAVQFVLELQGVHAGPRPRSQRAKLDHLRRRSVDHESFGHQDQRFRSVNRPKAREKVAERTRRLP